MYIYGGNNKTLGFQKDLLKITTTGHVEEIKIKGVALQKHGAFVYENKMYIFGGCLSMHENSANLYEFDP